MQSFPRLELRLGGYFFVYRMGNEMSDAMTDIRNNKKLRDEIEELRKQLENRCDDVAKLSKDVKMLREFVKLLRDYIPVSAVGNITVQEALSATEHHDRS